MHVQLSDAAAANIERLVQQGAFADADRAVEAAIELLTESQVEYDDELHRMILEGIASSDSGRGTRLTPEAIEGVKRRGRLLLEERQRS